MSSKKISAVIITFNEEKNITRCIQSLQEVADEIVVVDSFSTDTTEEICASFKISFIQHKFEGHIEQKNWAMQQAKYDHILSLDADEALSDKLKNEILKLKESNSWNFEGYSMNRITSFCGNWIKHTWYPDKKLRLWDRTKGEWGGDNPHDKFIMFGNQSTGFIKGDLLHYSYNDLTEYSLQIEKFSTIAAEAAFKKGKRTSQLGIYAHAIVKFFKKYFINRGFLDGWDGLYISVSTAYYTMLKYSKLYRKQNDNK